MTEALGAGSVAHVAWWRTERIAWWLRTWRLAFAIYTLVWILHLIQSSVSIVDAGYRIQWPLLLTNSGITEYLNAALVPPIVLLARAYPINQAYWRHSLPPLLLGCAIYLVVKDGMEDGLLYLFFPQHACAFPRCIASNLLAPITNYFTIVAVTHAIDLYRREQERTRLTVELRERLTGARLDALRSQLQPHFLFNTLNSAATLMHSDIDAADRMLTRLSDLLRVTLAQGGPHEVPLAAELELLDRYLAIMRVRFRDRLTVAVDSGGAEAALVPQLLLQPLAENALEHGLAERPGPGRLEIRIRREGSRLRITVTDDGPGPRSPARGEFGVGLANTRARLEQLYGEAQSLTLEPAAPDGGARVTVTLPWHTEAAGIPEPGGPGR